VRPSLEEVFASDMMAGKASAKSVHEEADMPEVYALWTPQSSDWTQTVPRDGAPDPGSTPRMSDKSAGPCGGLPLAG